MHEPPAASGRPGYELWAVFEGSGGAGAPAAARAAASWLPEELARRMPAAPLPADAGRYDAATLEYAARARLAAVATLLSLHAQLLERAATAAAGAGSGSLCSGGGSGGLCGASSDELSVGGLGASSPGAAGDVSLMLLGDAAAAGYGGYGCGAGGSGSGALGGGGVTATVVVRTGCLLTVANVGSCRAVLDVGVARVELTESDRVGCNEAEEARLAMGEQQGCGLGKGDGLEGAPKEVGGRGTQTGQSTCPSSHRPIVHKKTSTTRNAAGADVARLKLDLSGPAAPGEDGCGPLRAWPGGSRHSRALGCRDAATTTSAGAGVTTATACPDADAEASPVVPFAHVRQVWLPPRPSRLVLASDGVWDAFDTHHKAPALLQSVSVRNAAEVLVQQLARRGRAARRGDRSAFVVDFVPAAPPAPATAAAAAGGVLKRIGSAALGRSLSLSRGGSGTAAASDAADAAASSFKQAVRLDRLSRASSGRAAASASASVRGGSSACGSSSVGRYSAPGKAPHHHQHHHHQLDHHRHPDQQQHHQQHGSSASCSPHASWTGGASAFSRGSHASSLAPPPAWASMQRPSGPPPRGQLRERAAAARRRAAAAAAGGAARALLARLCLAPRTVGGIPEAADGSVRAGGAFISLTVHALDALEAYAGGRAGSEAEVLAALDAGLAAAAAADARAATAAAAAAAVASAAAPRGAEGSTAGAKVMQRSRTLPFPGWRGGAGGNGGGGGGGLLGLLRSVSLGTPPSAPAPAYVTRLSIALTE